MYIADFETTTSKISTKYSKVWVWGLKGTMKGDRLIYGNDLWSFFETIKEIRAKDIYFHNLSFDGNYIYKFLLNEADFKFINKTDPELKDYKLKPFEYSTIEDERGTMYSITVNWKDHTVTFLDSYKILVSSVEDLGKSLGLPKLEIDYHNYNIFKRKEDIPKEAIEYLERDIDVIIETLTKAFALYDKKMTRASMAENDFKNYYNNSYNSGRKYSADFGGWLWDYRQRQKVYQNVLTKNEWIFVNKSYQGGYTYWNQSITNKELNNIDGYSYDINSLYPSIMMYNKMPYGKAYHYPPLGHEYIKLHNISIHWAKLKDPNYPPLIKIKGGRYTMSKYYTELENEEYTFWDDELKFIEDKYHMRYTIRKTLYFKTKFIFKDWLNEKKQLKINAPNTVERNFHKGIYNSTYGKFAQNIRIGARIIVKDGLHVKEIDGEKWLVNTKTGELQRKMAKNAIRYGKKGQFKHEPYFTESDRFKYIPIASYITSLARLELWKVQYANLDIWLYSDTDSCYFKGIPKHIDIHESRFGAWKAEYRFNRFKVLRAKAYIFKATHEWKNGKWTSIDEIVKKISGLSKKGKEKVTFDNFYLGSIIKNGKRGVKNVEGGKLIYDTDFKFGENGFI